MDDQTSVTDSTGSVVDTPTSFSFALAAGDLNLESNEVVIVNDFAQAIGVLQSKLGQLWMQLILTPLLKAQLMHMANFVNGGSTAVADPLNQ
ncbi:MAG: hypothetical protein U5K27_05895 [Desulfotignum sp.]|nr:hypothetical protein [Desulfotignum sp.]